MTQEQILKNYESAKAVYKDWGVDVEKVLEEFAKIKISVHCWQGDDVHGFEGIQAESQNLHVCRKASSQKRSHR